MIMKQDEFNRYLENLAQESKKICLFWITL